MFVAGRTLGPLLLAVALVTGCGGPQERAQTDPTQTAGGTAEPSLDALAAHARQQPLQPFWPTMMADSCRRAGDASAAAEHLRAALAKDPDYAPALSRLARLYYERGQHDAAIVLLEQARARQGELAEPLRIGLALHYLALQRNEESAALLATLEREPESLQGLRLLTSDDYLQAFSITEKAVRDHPEVASNHNNHGISLLYRGEPELAKEAFTRALELAPDLAGAMYNLAIVERFYFFDEENGRKWFARYRERAEADPDGLAELLAARPAAATEGK